MSESIAVPHFGGGEFKNKKQFYRETVALPDDCQNCNIASHTISFHNHYSTLIQIEEQPNPS